MKARLSTLALLLILALAAGCIVHEQILVEVAINDKLSGDVVIEMTGIHSTENDARERAEELEAFMADDAESVGQEWVTMFGLEKATVGVTNRTLESCDLVVAGRFNNLARVFSVFAGDGDFELKQSGPHFLVRIPASDAFGEPGEGNDPILIAVQYTGSLFSHNADEYDAETGTWSWHSRTLSTHGLHLILERVPVERSQ